MAFLKTKGIIIKEVNTGEADKVVTIFTESKGKISAYARGARRPKNSLTASTQFLCYSDFVFFSGKEMYSINSCRLIEHFYNLRNDIIRLTYSAYFAEIINDVVQENEPAMSLLKLFLNSLYLLAAGKHDPRFIARVFEMRLLVLSGYSPDVRGCMACSGTDLDNVSFSFESCGFLCSNCSQTDKSSYKLSPAAARAIQYIAFSDSDSLFGFRVSESVLNELEHVFGRYLSERLEKKYTTLDFLKTIT
ncbi:MAG TPA: DNA repair protein RecO [Clostridiaceae bacterium]|nr:DNA repair protein RecO [Clostridiaceae bacterium]